MKILKEYDLVVFENLFLGKLLFILDARENLSLKLSLGYRSQVLLDKRNPDRYNSNVEDLFSYKEAPSGLSLEYSYKFSNQKLEIKNELREGSIERYFYGVKIPAESPLLLMRLSGTLPLEDKSPYCNPVLVDEELNSKTLVISFSFPGSNGKPWTDELMANKTGRRTEIVVPMKITPSRFFIWTTSDDHPRNDGVSIWIPETHKLTKIS